MGTILEGEWQPWHEITHRPRSTAKGGEARRDDEEAGPASGAGDTQKWERASASRALRQSVSCPTRTPTLHQA